MSVSNQTPWHLWLVGTITLLWNAMGALDYYMSQTKNEAYLSMFTPEQLDFFYSFPSWSVALWALAVWGGLLGCVLLLLRKQLAVQVFLISLVCVIVNTIYMYGFTNGLEIIGDPISLGFSVAVIIVAIFLYLYAKKMRAQNILN